LKNKDGGICASGKGVYGETRLRLRLRLRTRQRYWRLFSTSTCKIYGNHYRNTPIYPDITHTLEYFKFQKTADRPGPFFDAARGSKSPPAVIRKPFCKYTGYKSADGKCHIACKQPVEFCSSAASKCHRPDCPEDG
ncbi:MAG: hypothetical protein AABZ21_03380, partial [Deltaproteobacteria bacterium]